MLQLEILQYAEISVFGRFAVLHVDMAGISEVVQTSYAGGSLIPHMWDQWAKKNFFSYEIFSKANDTTDILQTFR